MLRLAPTIAALLCGCSLPLASVAVAQEADFPPSEKVLEGFERVESRSPDGQTLGNIYKREKDSQVFIELPKDYSAKKYFIAMTVSSGDEYAGLQAGDYYVYWRRYDDRLALILPNLDVRSSGEPESRSSVKRLFTDRVLADVPIETMVPRGGPVIDADKLFVDNASTFFGSAHRPTNTRLVKIIKAKSFSKNLELAFEIVGRGGVLQTLHYSLSEVPEASGYKPRESDQRVGYFVTAYSDLGKYDEEDTRTRYINRWRLEKRDPSLKVSPPVTPIRFYVEHTTPVRYRRWVKQGVDYWNDAFEKIGFSDAVEVYYQDSSTGAYMDLDPEDVQYNFIRWLNNDQGTAIGPTRVHPMTGEILDADIVLTDGWIRHFKMQFDKVMPEIATEGFSPETIAWLAKHPNWDPRIRFAEPADRESVAKAIATAAAMPMAGHPATRVDPQLLGNNPFDGLVGRTSQVNGLCLAARGKQMQLAMGRMAFELLSVAELANEEEKKDPAEETKTEDPSAESDSDAAKKDAAAKDDSEKKDEADKKDDADKKEDVAEKDSADKKEDAAKKEETPPEQKLDGMPESFIGPLVAELVSHEVGHTLGLRHNFKASSIYGLGEMNSKDVAGAKPLAGSVMDYLPINLPIGVGDARGDYTMIGIGPYDYWAIEYGYTPNDGELPKILARVAEPQLQFATDEDTYGPDPLARRYDHSKDPLEYARSQVELAAKFRERLLEKYVDEGDSWAKAREGYELTLAMQQRSISMIANWIGGAFVHRDKKGDPNGRDPIDPVPAKIQRESLKFVIEHSFEDDAYGLNPEILQKMTLDKWFDDTSTVFADSTFPIHDRVLQVQASALTALLNPTTLRRVLDNERIVPLDEDALTLPELLGTITDSIWRELDNDASGEVSDRKPQISSLRRSLQREHVQRLIDLMIDPDDGNAATVQIATIATAQLRDISRTIERRLEDRKNLDAYSSAHLAEVASRIDRALEGEYIYNLPKNFGMGGMPLIIFGNESQPNLDSVYPAESPR